MTVAQKRQFLALFCLFIEWQIRGKSSDQLQAFLEPPKDDVPLSPRMRQTLELLLAGASEKQVARQLGVSQHTIHVYVKDIYQRFEVSSRAELMSRFVRPTPGGRK